MSQEGWTISRADVIGTLASVVVLAAAGYFAVGGALRASRAVSEEHARLAAELERLTQVANLVQRAETAVASVETEFEMLNRYLPDALDFEGFYSEVLSLAAETGTSLERVQPGEIQPAEGYSSLPMSIEATGDFEGFYSLVHALVTLPRLCKVASIGLVATGDPGVCRIRLNVRIYAASRVTA